MHNCQKINSINVSITCDDKPFHLPTWKNVSKDRFYKHSQLSKFDFLHKDIESKHYFATHITGTGCIDFARNNRKAKSKILA